MQCRKRTKATDKIVGRYKKYIVIYKDNKIIIQSEDLGSNEHLKKEIINPYINEHSNAFFNKPNNIMTKNIKNDNYNKNMMNNKTKVIYNFPKKSNEKL